MSAFHCISFIADNFEAIKEFLPLGTKPLDFFIIVAGAYHSRNYTLHSNSQKFADSEPEYDFQVSTYITSFCTLCINFKDTSSYLYKYLVLFRVRYKSCF